MCFSILCKKQSEETSHGWTKSTVILGILLCQFTPSISFAASAVALSSDPTLFDNGSIAKLIIALIGILIGSALIPAFKNFLNQRSIKKSYISYLQANVKSTLTHYGSECAVVDACSELGIQKVGWVENLDSESLGVPEFITAVHSLIEKSKTSQEKYIPYVTYAAMPITELDHEHPIWSLNEGETHVIADYLLSQSQVQKSIEFLYQSPFFDLAHKDDTKHLQWINAAFVIIDELAEHYINTHKLRKMIKNNYKLEVIV